MFNEEIKLRYKTEKEATTVVPKNAINLDFQKTEPFEESLGKDVHDFTTEEILNMYKTWNIKSVDHLYVINNRLSQYVQWALTQNLVVDSQNHFVEINRTTILSCVNQIAQELRIVPREQIIAWCSRLPNACDKWCFLGLFEGLEGKDFEDLWNTSIDDIDKVNQTVRLKDRTLTISKDLIEYAEEANEMTELQPMAGNFNRTMALIDTGKIIKIKFNTRYTDPAHMGKATYITIKRVCVYLGIDRWFNTKQLHESGMVWFIKKRCEELGITPHKYLFSNRIQEANKRFNRKIVRSSFYTKYKNYLEN